MMGNGGGRHTLHGHDFAAIHFFAGRNGLEDHQPRFVRECLGYLLYLNSFHGGVSVERDMGPRPHGARARSLTPACKKKM